MKKKRMKILFTLVALTIAPLTSARAQDYVNYATSDTTGNVFTRGGLSVGAHGGLFYIQDIEEFGVQVKFDRGLGFDVPVSIHMGNGLALEFSGGYYNAEVDGIKGKRGKFGIKDTDSDLTLVPLMASGVVRLPASETLAFYVGGGVGAYYTKIDVDSIDDFKLDITGKNLNLGFNAKAGLNFGLTDNLMLDVGYKYQQVINEGDDLRGHTLEAGVTIKF